ncbi:hypothetical protein BMETH_1395_0 [methanotrophic bacterial endosymbiont of Bathymodiolus sp.]|nr:hypothetical protein BMETH_1395_0 [methanotrophic bacterial endosymbiont of Bathymodiolus sp.]
MFDTCSNLYFVNSRSSNVRYGTILGANSILITASSGL